jgi:hypothetical protein
VGGDFLRSNVGEIIGFALPIAALVNASIPSERIDFLVRGEKKRSRKREGRFMHCAVSAGILLLARLL